MPKAPKPTPPKIVQVPRPSSVPLGPKPRTTDQPPKKK
jgi:hypothetical protein